MSIFTKDKLHKNPAFAESYSQMKEFTIAGTLMSPLFKCGDNVGWKAREELRNLIQQVKSPLSEGEVFVTFFDNKEGRGAIVYTEKGGQPLILVPNALLGAKNSSGDLVAELLLLELGLLPESLSCLMPDLRTRAKRQRRENSTGGYEITVRV